MHCGTTHTKADNFLDFQGIAYELKIILQEVILLDVAEKTKIAHNVKYNTQLHLTFKLVYVCVCVCERENLQETSEREKISNLYNLRHSRFISELLNMFLELADLLSEFKRTLCLC